MLEQIATLLERHLATVKKGIAVLSEFKPATSADIQNIKVQLEESNKERDIQFDEIEAKLDDLMDHFGVKRREAANDEASGADP